MHTYRHTYIYIPYIHIYTCTYTYVHNSCIHIHAYIYTNRHTHFDIHTTPYSMDISLKGGCQRKERICESYKHTYTHTYICIYIYIYIYTYIYIYIYTQRGYKPEERASKKGKNLEAHMYIYI
jgi:hypothetical protein